jgi:hypothetical protein
LIIISEARVNIEIKKAPKITIIKIIPKVLKKIHAEITKVFFKEKVIPKTLNNIVPRDTRSIINQGVSLKTI